MGNDGLIETAESVAIQLSRILDKANVEFNVTGFYGNGGREAIKASGANKVDVEVRYEKPTFVPFKTWKDSLQKASAKLGSIRHWAQSSTPDYSSISITLEDLGLRTEQRKILFLITDANGYNKVHMRHLQNVADRLGIKLVAIGIGRTDVKECFRSSENVKSVNDLASATFNKLLKELQ